MATPFVSGVSALVYSMLGERDAGNEAATEGFLRADAQPLGLTDPAYATLLGAGRVSAIGSVTGVLQSRSSAMNEADPITRLPAP